MVDREAVKTVLRRQRIELPSWAFGNSGTRFKVFAQPGVPRDPFEKIADAAQVHRYTGVAPSVALHIPWDRVDDYAELAGARRGPRHRARHDQRQRLPGRRLQARQRHQPRPADPAQGAGPPARVRRRHGRRPARATSSCGSPTARTTRARTTSAARQDRLAEALAGGVRAARRAPAADPRVQAVRAGVLHDGRAGLGHVVRALPAAGRAGEGVRRHRPPRAGHQHRVHRRVPAAGREARRVRLQLPLLRRRRPDGRRGRSVPAVPDPVRGRRRPAASTTTPTSPSCSTSATTSSRRSPARSAR